MRDGWYMIDRQTRQYKESTIRRSVDCIMHGILGIEKRDARSKQMGHHASDLTPIWGKKWL